MGYIIYLSLPKSVPNAGDQLAPLYLALLRCLFGLTVFFRLLSVYCYIVILCSSLELAMKTGP